MIVRFVRRILRTASALTLGLMIGFAPVCHAAIVHDLFRVQVPVGAAPPSTDLTPVFQQAARNILRRLGVRVQSQATIPVVSAILADPQHWIAEYGYDRQAATGAFDIWVRFESHELMQTLLRGGIPVWGRERPQILFLIRVPTIDGRRLLGATTLGSLDQALEDEAARRGLPVVLPVMDLSSLRLLGSGILGSGSTISLAQRLRSRYAFDALLTGSIESLGSGRWAGEFHLWTGGDSVRVLPLRSAASRQALLRDLVRHLATLFAQRDAILPGGHEHRVLIDVRGLSRLADLVRTDRLLSRILGVRRLELRTVNGRDRATWSLETRLPLSRLERLIALSDFLHVLASTPLMEMPSSLKGRLQFQFGS